MGMKKPSDHTPTSVSPEREAPTHADVEVGSIIVGGRKRAFSTERARELAHSIERVGLLHPVAVTPSLRLVAGLHRLEAHKILGRTHVPCVVLTDDALLGELAEIEENLVRQDLTVLERGEHHKRAKEIYEASPFGPDDERNNFAAQPYTAEMAGKSGVSRRTVEQEIQIASWLDEAVKGLIRGTPLDDRKADLLFLARLPAQSQKKVVAMVNKGQVKTVRQAHRVLQGKTPSDDKRRADGLRNLRRILELAAAGPTWEGAGDGEAARLLAGHEGASDAIRLALTSALRLISVKGSSGRKARMKTRRTGGAGSSHRRDRRAASLSNLPLFEGAP
jgi:ParB family transcriptional regulator, chromosome partitioning protein